MVNIPIREIGRAPIDGQAKWYYYLLLALVDVEANFLVVKAYQYTSLTSVMLLDCWTIPCVIILTWFFLKTKYRFRKFVGVGVCIAGLVLVVFSDVHAGDRAGGSHPIRGDLLVIAGATLYAVTNTSEEFLVKNADRVEVMAMLGLFGAIISGCQIAILERQELRSIHWSAGALLPFIGFAAAMFLFYSTVPILLKISGATMLNLSLLTSDMWAVLIRIFAYHEKVDWMYFIAFAAVAVGLIIYSGGSKEEEESKTQVAADAPAEQSKARDEEAGFGNQNQGSSTLKTDDDRPKVRRKDNSFDIEEIEEGFLICGVTDVREREWFFVIRTRQKRDQCNGVAVVPLFRTFDDRLWKHDDLPKEKTKDQSALNLVTTRKALDIILDHGSKFHFASECSMVENVLGHFILVESLETSLISTGQDHTKGLSIHISDKCDAAEWMVNPVCHNPYLASYEPTTQIQRDCWCGGGRNPVKGDLLVIAGATVATLIADISNSLVKMENADIVEAAAMVSLFGAVVSGCQIAILERQELRSIHWSAGVVLPFIGLTAAMFLAHALGPFLTKFGGFNPFSLLTSNIWAVLIRIFVYHEKVDWIYFIAYAALAVGLVLNIGEDEIELLNAL
ncbi:Solute carrier family 35 member SLC35F1/F2/F6 [Macleaya cordata]|uniref:Solute carrier family 35 member SLC35F1/F2/F6 n=1 Tax=Macleaya cordata TaxID=56857 RepID=A0A200QLS6_MACCD|nr:Solute carrier family 35 member SLC35F1/F2/F6 [Macleaya cordata]